MGPGRIGGDELLQPLSLDQMPEHTLGTGRTTDVPHANKQHFNHIDCL
jgi:hypothetical protein